jgi:hypothetical protein
LGPPARPGRDRESDRSRSALDASRLSRDNCCPERALAGRPKTRLRRMIASGRGECIHGHPFQYFARSQSMSTRCEACSRLWNLHKAEIQDGTSVRSARSVASRSPQGSSTAPADNSVPAGRDPGDTICVICQERGRTERTPWPAHWGDRPLLVVADIQFSCGNCGRRCCPQCGETEGLLMSGRDPYAYIQNSEEPWMFSCPTCEYEATYWVEWATQGWPS